MNTPPNHKLWVYCLWPAVAMSLGWGLRGFIGGGPLGAMIPGAMIGLLLCFLLGLDKKTSVFVAVFATIGVGFGGQMTYGQTIGFVVRPETFGWGVLGLTVKGGVWGLIGGAVIGLGFIQRQIPKRHTVTGLVLLLLGTLVGWKLINEPKLIYFSDPLVKPRAEIWAGLLIGTIFLLTHLASQRHAKIPLHFALWGALGGAIGFGGGGLWMWLGKALSPELRWVSWWKLMEFTFGFCFGLTLGYAAWLKRAVLAAVPANLEPEAARSRSIGWVLLITALVGFASLWLETNLTINSTFTFVGVGLLIISIYSERLAWQIALTVTYSAFALDLAEYFYKERKMGDAFTGWMFVLATSLAFGYLVAKRVRSGEPMVKWGFLLVMWTAVLVSVAKTLMHPPPFESFGLVQGIFFLDTILLAVWLRGKNAPA